MKLGKIIRVAAMADEEETGILHGYDLSCKQKSTSTICLLIYLVIGLT